MSYNNNLRQDIIGSITSPADPKISGIMLQQKLLAIVDAIGAGGVFLGTAATDTVPGTTVNGFYLATTVGTYTNFIDTSAKPLVIAEGEIALLSSIEQNGSVRWAKNVLPGRGEAAYIHIMYAESQPAQDSDMHDTFQQLTDKYIGICADANETAPTDYRLYTWAKFVGEDGAPGRDAINPFKGWFDADITGEVGSRVIDNMANLPDNPSVGFYAYVKTIEVDPQDTSIETDVVKIYECAIAGQWSDSGRTFQPSKDPSFKSGQSLNAVGIDDTHLVNAVSDDEENAPMLPKASDVQLLKQKLRSVTLQETLATSTTDWFPEGSMPGFYKIGDEGDIDWETSEVYRSTKIDVTDQQRVRFFGFSKDFQKKFAFGFLNIDSVPIEGSFGRYYDASKPLGTCEYIVEVPKGAVYFVCLYQAWSSLTEYQMFQSDQFYCYLEKGETFDDCINRIIRLIPIVEDNLFSKSGTDALSARQGAIIADLINPFKDFQFRGYVLKKWRIYWSGKELVWHNTDGSACFLVPVREGEEFVIYKDSDGSCGWAFLKEYPETFTEGGHVDFVDDTTLNLFKTEINPVTSVTVVIPPSCNCLYLTKRASQNQSVNHVAPTRVEKRPPISEAMLQTGPRAAPRNDFLGRYNQIGLTPLNVSVDSVGWEIPKSLQQLNVVKKSNQLRFLQWIPKNNIPADYNAEGDLEVIQPNAVFPHGIPYSSNWQDYKYPGVTVSIYSFLTAVNNPFSLLYTECVRSSYPKSAWRRKWVNANATSYYGLVCCGFTAAVTGCPTVWNNGQFDDLAEQGEEFLRIAAEGVFIPALLKIGDIFDSSSHSFAIYGLQRDSNGNIIKIRVAECTRGISNGSGCRIYDFTPSNFPGNDFAHYRYIPLPDNWKFVEEPTDFDTIGENHSNSDVITQPSQNYSNEICTFAGDKVSFAIGAINDLIVINYDLDGYSIGDYDQIRLYYNNELRETFLLSDADGTLVGVFDIANSYNQIDQNGHAIVVATKESTLPAGEYHACFATGEVESDEKTFFEILENNVTAYDDGDYYLVEYQNKINACYIGTLIPNEGDPYFSPKIKHVVSFDEIDKKQLKIYKSDLEGYSVNDLYLRLMTVGKYGVARVVVKLINTD